MKTLKLKMKEANDMPREVKAKLMKKQKTWEDCNLLYFQSVLAPGFFTLASNVVTSSIKEITPEMPRYGWWFIFFILLNSLFRWKQEYMTTSHKVILAETFSPTFVGLTFQVRTSMLFVRFILRYLFPEILEFIL